MKIYSKFLKCGLLCSKRTIYIHVTNSNNNDIGIKISKNLICEFQVDSPLWK